MSSDRVSVPPHSMEAEQSVLGALLIDNDKWDRVADLLVAKDFYRLEHREIFDAIGMLVSACKTADIITVHEFLRTTESNRSSDMAYLNALAQSVPSASNARGYAEIVKGYSLTRGLIQSLQEAGDIAWKSEVGFAEKLDSIQTLFAHLGKQHIRKAPKSFAEIAVKRIDYYTALEAGEISAGWPTGMPKLDQLLNGGLRPGALVILAARPKVGKSSLALTFAERMAAASLPTLVLSQEMPDTEVVDRSVVHAGRVDYSALMSGKMSQEDWSRASDGLHHISALPMYVDDQAALTINDIRSKARMIKGLKVLVLDYLQLCAGTKEGDNRNTQIEGITRGLKSLAKSDQIAVVALSQLNRKVDERANKRPQLSDLRDSGSIEQDADVVLFLWPVREMSDGRKLVGCAVEANRQGANGAFALDFDGARQRWGESLMSLDQPAAGKFNRDRGFNDD